jgi:hypothetical protein
MCQGANINFLSLCSLLANTVLYDWKDRGHTKQDKVRPVQENIGKGLNVSGQIIYC